MNEQEARHVILLQAHEAEGSRHWSADDRRWATRQAVAVVGDDATPERFVVARATLALQRLLPRDAAARRWLERRAWSPAWVWLGAVLGLIAGLVADRLGPPDHVSVLAPAVWAVVVWNLLVYGFAFTPWHGGAGSQLGPWFARRGQGVDLAASLLWARHAAPLSMKRAALVLHTMAATLALGLIAGLYLRGLVLDYRAGWQSTFLDAQAVQSVLGVLLAPASWLTGIAVPEVAPLRVGPAEAAHASARPWIHLYAATLALWVVLPRVLLASWSAWRARALARRFPLDLATPYFEALHPLMRPGVSRVLRLLWLAPPEPRSVRLLGHDVPLDLRAPVTLWRSDEGDELQLVPGAAPPAVAVPGSRWWQRWSRPVAPPTPQADAVLLLQVPGVAPAADATSLQRPVLVLRDAELADPPALPLRSLGDGWLPEGRLWSALEALVGHDARVQRLAAAWRARQETLLRDGVDEIARTLAQVAATREPVPDAPPLPTGAARADAEAARELARDALLAALNQALAAHRLRVLALLGRADEAAAAPEAVPAAEVALRSKVGEGRAAVVGGLLSGAAAGLKADVLSGGLTMGAGALAGGLLGALGAAGAARGLNVLRGTDRSHVAWDDVALQAIATALLQRWARLACGRSAEAIDEPVAAAVARHRAALAHAWSARGSTDEARQKVAAALHAPLLESLQQALGHPASTPR